MFRPVQHYLAIGFGEGGLRQFRGMLGTRSVPLASPTRHCRRVRQLNRRVGPRLQRGRDLGQTPQQTQDAGVAPVDVLVVRLVEIGKQAAVTASDAIDAVQVAQVFRRRQWSAVGNVVMHDAQSLASDLSQCIRIVG